MSLYPTVEPPDQKFRLGKIQEIDRFLGQEAQSRLRIQKKYLRAVNFAHWLSTGAGLVGVGLEATGIPLMVTGVGTVPGIVLSALGAGAFGANLVCDTIIHRCTKKAIKHAEIARCASDKLMSIHKQVSDGLRDASISAEEFDMILEEEAQYQRTKEEIRAKAAATDEAERKKAYERGKEDMMKELASRLGAQ